MFSAAFAMFVRVVGVLYRWGTLHRGVDDEPSVAPVRHVRLGGRASEVAVAAINARSFR